MFWYCASDPSDAVGRTEAAVYRHLHRIWRREKPAAITAFSGRPLPSSECYARNTVAIRHLLSHIPLWAP